MRRAAKVDANQAEVVKALRKIGIQVKPTHMVGDGFPDLVCCHRGRNVLLEVKMPGEPLTKDQVEFIAIWGGEMHVVHSPQEAVAAMVGKDALR